MLVSICRSSAKTVRLSKWPVVLRVLEDDDAVAQRQVEALLAIRVGVVLRDPEPAALHPKHMAMGCCTSGSAAKTVALKPGGRCIIPSAFSGGVSGMVSGWLFVRRGKLRGR